MPVEFARLDGIRVFVTGNTGFKGAWSVALLQSLGATVTGYSLPPPSSPSLFEEARLAQRFSWVNGDIRDVDALRAAIREARPDCVLHMAAQSLVIEGFKDPVGTFSTNVTGTVNVLEASRGIDSIRFVLVVTTDKCYRPSAHPLRESDPLGGHDPYSASKAGAELVVEGYRPLFGDAGNGPIIATARAGNVIGGGDWSANRLIPDLARAMLGDRKIAVRHPDAIRPWQHVLDALSGYCMLMSRGVRGDRSVGRPWNFGPEIEPRLSVREAIDAFAQAYGQPLAIETVASTIPENPLLLLDATESRRMLGWKPMFDAREALAQAAAFYRERAGGGSAGELLDRSISQALKA
jgi:CDP-glucose 4,6-dehydratase